MQCRGATLNLFLMAMAFILQWNSLKGLTKCVVHYRLVYIICSSIKQSFTYNNMQTHVFSCTVPPKYLSDMPLRNGLLIAAVSKLKHAFRILSIASGTSRTLWVSFFKNALKNTGNPRAAERDCGSGDTEKRARQAVQGTNAGNQRYSRSIDCFAYPKLQNSNRNIL